MAANIADLRFLFYGGGIDQEYQTLSDMVSAGVTARSLITIGSDQLTSGVESMPRHAATANVTMSSQTLRFLYFTSRKSFTATQLSTISAGTAAGATPTLCRMGLYTVATNGDLTLVASTTNDTALWATINTQYTRPISGPSGITSYPVVAGTRYALGALCVTAATAPTLVGSNTFAVSMALDPRLGGGVASMADLPTSIAVGTLSTSFAAFPLGLVLP